MTAATPTAPGIVIPGQQLLTAIADGPDGEQMVLTTSAAGGLIQARIALTGAGARELAGVLAAFADAHERPALHLPAGAGRLTPVNGSFS